MSVHDAAKQGYEIAASTYVAGRPSYPDEALDWLKNVLGVGPGMCTLEVGAGTGKFLPLLAACGGQILALEPVDGMRARLSQDFPDVKSIAGSADAIPLGDASVDVVVCAQAFHWFATSAALAEMRRVLKPGGMLGLIWNGRDESVPWVAALSAITDKWQGDTPRYKSGEWRNAFPTHGLTAVDSRFAHHGHSGRPSDVILGRTMSVSFIAALPPEQRSRVEREVKELIETAPELAGKEAVTFPYETAMYAFQKTGNGS